jgi:hypothetical protein
MLRVNVDGHDSRCKYFNNFCRRVFTIYNDKSSACVNILEETLLVIQVAGRIYTRI